MASFMRASSSRSTGAPSLRTMPVMPHTLVFGTQHAEIRWLSRCGKVVLASSWIRTPGEASARFLSLFCSPPRDLFSLVSHKNESNGHKDKVEDQQLRALAICRADISLKNRIGQRKQCCEDQYGRNLSQLVLNCEP